MCRGEREEGRGRESPGLPYQELYQLTLPSAGHEAKEHHLEGEEVRSHQGGVRQYLPKTEKLWEYLKDGSRASSGGGWSYWVELGWVWLHWTGLTEG